MTIEARHTKAGDIGVTPSLPLLALRGAKIVLAALAIFLAVGVFDFALADPFGVSQGSTPPEFGGFAGWILAEQSMFYQMLSGAIRSAKSNGSAVYALLGISFIYGIFHAAGPGHGKAVISSYLVANHETWRRGIVLSAASAALQSLTAILIVAVAALLLNATAKMMDNTVNIIETVSYVLIVLIGARLSWVKGRAFLKLLWTETHGHPRDHHHDHEEENASAWGHAHALEPRELAGPRGWRRGLATVVSVGVRPCLGAIIVLVFSLAQGLFWIGVVSTFMMGFGTAITVASIATLAVGARGIAAKIARAKPGRGLLFLRGLETAAAALVMIFGFLLLTGYMMSEKLMGI
ncbi:MAG TPA: nickel/cobalt transporter [Stellaceae bacterium]|nr:nickel/cobalt transporter [Stellaceae bacterium]